MKKLMIAAAIVCAAAFAQAGTCNWSSMYLNVYGEAGYTAPVVNGQTVYLICGSASTFLTDVVANDFATALGNATVWASATQNEGSLSNGASTMWPVAQSGADLTLGNNEAQIPGANYTLFMVMDDTAHDAVYLSEEVTVPVPGQGAKSAIFGHDGSVAGNIFDANDGYTTGGYYTVPEPTSGLLLLLGVAGMALRRRRA